MKTANQILAGHNVPSTHDCLITDGYDVVWGSGESFDAARDDARLTLADSAEDIEQALSECVAETRREFEARLG